MKGIQVIHQAGEDVLAPRGVRQWDIWTKEVSKFPWTYDCTEHCYFLSGEVVVTTEGEAPVQIGTGDFVTFAAGLSCTWDIRSPVRKHYRFED